MRIACVNMQRNEDICLEPWLKYHGYLFGFENLFIIDHNSDSPHTVNVLKYFETRGLHVTHLSKDTDYKDKGRIVSEEIRRIDKLEKFDFVFPIDCDEFLFLNSPNGSPTCRRSDILDYLQQFVRFPGMLEIKENFLHILGHPGYFWSQPYQKVFFTGGNCLSLDHGSHVGWARDSKESKATNLVYAHFHFKPYFLNQELSREKLRPFVDVDDLDALRKFDGPGSHLKLHLFSSEEEYYSLFRVDPAAIFFKEIVDLFELIGINPNFSMMDLDGRVFRSPPFVGVGDVNAFSEEQNLRDELLKRLQSEYAARSMAEDNLVSGRMASQSSISDWSYRRNSDNDAAGGIDGKADGTFGFHTDVEDSPWWMVDLETSCGIREVRIYNRLDNSGIARRASRLVIEIGLEVDHLVEVYRRETDEPFGGIDGNPLVFKPTIPIPGRFVRIRLLTRNYLHLDQVEVYGEALPGLVGAAAE